MLPRSPTYIFNPLLTCLLYNCFQWRYICAGLVIANK
jgi:hypothetical protein